MDKIKVVLVLSFECDEDMVVAHSANLLERSRALFTPGQKVHTHIGIESIAESVLKLVDRMD